MYFLGDAAGSLTAGDEVKTESGSNPRASPSASNCAMDGKKSCFSSRERSAWLIPVASASCCWGIDCSFLLVVTRLESRDMDSFFMVGVPFYVVITNVIIDNIVCTLMVRAKL